MAPRRRKPSSPTDLPPRSWRAIARRTFDEFRDDNLMDWAAALTYYGVMSLFPMLIVLVAVLGLFGRPETVSALIDSLRTAGLDGIAENIEDPLNGVVENRGGAGALFGVGLAAALWSASGYVGAFIRASNAIYEVEEGRPFWKLRPFQLVVTLVAVLLLALVALGLVISGPLAEAVGDAVGLGETAVTVWGIAKWPVMLAIVMGMFAGLYYLAPNVRQPRFRWVTPGGVVGVLIWAAASAAFAVYVANFGSYNKTYGTLGGVISFLVWLWISNVAVLLGAELDAELERERELEMGLDAEREIKLAPRQEPAS